MAVDVFLKIEGVDGESQDDKHKGEIDVLSWSWGLSQTGTMHLSGGGGAGKVNIQDLTVTKYIDKSTPNLVKMCCAGDQFKKVTLTCRKAGKNPLEYVIIELEHVMISSLTSGGASNDERLLETVGFNFATVHFNYQPQKNDGSADGGAISMAWNIAANKEAG